MTKPFIRLPKAIAIITIAVIVLSWLTSCHASKRVATSETHKDSTATIVKKEAAVKKAGTFSVHTAKKRSGQKMSKRQTDNDKKVTETSECEHDNNQV